MEKRKRRRGTYRGNSMLRVFRPGDFLRLQPCRISELRPGDIICFRHDDHCVIHRVIGLLPQGRARTQGDNNPRPDPYTVGDDDLPELATHVRRGRRWHPVAGGARGMLNFRCNRLRRLIRRAVGKGLRLLPAAPLSRFRRGRYTGLQYYSFGKLECLMLGDRVVARRERPGRHWIIPDRKERLFLSAASLDRRFPCRKESGDAE